nr:acetyl-CoA carboxylase carboxyltransferase beta subunit [Plantago coronopus]
MNIRLKLKYEELLHLQDLEDKDLENSEYQKWLCQNSFELTREDSRKWGISRFIATEGLVSECDEELGNSEYEELGNSEDHNGESETNSTDNPKSLEPRPDYSHLWAFCENCYGQNYKQFFSSKLFICEYCDEHLGMNSLERIIFTIDPNTWDPSDENLVSGDQILLWDDHEEEAEALPPEGGLMGVDQGGGPRIFTSLGAGALDPDESDSNSSSSNEEESSKEESKEESEEELEEESSKEELEEESSLEESEEELEEESSKEESSKEESSKEESSLEESEEESSKEESSKEESSKEKSSKEELEEELEEEPYEDYLENYQTKTGLTEAVQTGLGRINDIPVAIAIMDFQFMGGSMGSLVGDKITRLIEYATNQSLPLIIVCASGGARMQEGSLSLIQMAKISSALYDFQSKERLFYVPILTSPTTGGVTASFGMLGDIIIAEPNAYIAFAGKRVIEELLKVIVPEGAQETENLFEKGLFDLIVPRTLLKAVLSELLQFHGFFPLKSN